MPLLSAGAALALEGLLTAAARFLSIHSTTTPTSGNELGAAGAYARVRIPPASWTIAGEVATTNAVLTFAAPTGDWSAAPRGLSIDLAGVRGADDLLLDGALSGTPRVPTDGDTVSFAAGALTATMALTSAEDLKLLSDFLRGMEGKPSAAEFRKVAKAFQRITGAPLIAIKGKPKLDVKRA